MAELAGIELPRCGGGVVTVGEWPVRASSEA